MTRADKVSVKVGDAPVLILPEKELGKHWETLQKIISIDDENTQSPTTWQQNFFQKVGLTRLNWADHRPKCFNTLYWPTGASRYASMWVLSQHEFAQGAVTVGLNVGLKHVTLWDMIVNRKVFLDNNLFAYEIVDRRYSNQWLTTDILPALDDFEWDDWQELWNRLIDISNFNGVIKDRAEISSSLVPDKYELRRFTETIGVLIDAVAAAMGKVVYCHSNYAYLVRPNSFFWPRNAAGITREYLNVFQEFETRGYLFSFRNYTRWHRDNSEPLWSSGGSWNRQAFIKCSAFYDGTNQSTLDDYTEEWVDKWGFVGTVTSNTAYGQHLARQHFWLARYSDLPDIEPKKIHPWPDQDYIAQGGDCWLFKFTADEVSTTYVPFDTSFRPDTLCVRDMDCTLLENLVVKTPVAGLPARSGIDVTPTSCDVYEGDPLTSTGDSVDVYSVGEAIGGDIYVIATLMNDGTYATGFGTGQSAKVEYARITKNVYPGGVGAGRIVTWTGSSWALAVGTEIPIGDSHTKNCALIGEIVQIYHSAQHGRHEMVGSSGLRRHVYMVLPLIPGRSDYNGPRECIPSGEGHLIEWDTAASQWAEAAFNSDRITVFDPAGRSVVLSSEVVAVQYNYVFGAWVIEGSHGLTRTGKVSSGPIDPDAIGRVALDNALFGDIFVLNTLGRAIGSNEQVTVIWRPDLNPENPNAACDHGNFYHEGEWEIVDQASRMVDVVLEHISGDKTPKYTLRDPITNAVLMNSVAVPIDPTAYPHKFRRISDLTHKNFATWGTAWFNVSTGDYALRWINETDQLDTCTQQSPGGS